MSNEKTTTVTFGIPFFMVSIAMLIEGGLFCMFAGPTAIFALRGEHFDGFVEYLESGLFVSWRYMAEQATGISSILVLVFVVAIAGILLTPFDRAFTFVISKIANFAAVSIGRSWTFFSPSNVDSEEYVRILEHLFQHPSNKLHWEWELMNLYIYWSVAFEVTLATSMMCFVVETLLVIGTFVGASCLFTVFALGHGILMSSVHRHYMRQLGQNQPNKANTTDR